MSKEVQFLGLDPNYKLTWKNHVNKTAIKMQQRINKLRHLKPKNLKSNVIMYLYKTIMRPIYMYANAAWVNVTKADISKIQNEQYKAIRLAYDLPMWTSVDEVNQIGNLETVSKTIQQLISEYLAGSIIQHKEIKNNGKTFNNSEPDKNVQIPLQNIL